ncbi:caspase-7-like [Malaclemys terrapin pileata]|uniref:caspase-7-like n=1 Tax=Malaclemys terrapin pileata TaxID=2991368 RepID=UPI0023A863B1|nr:caspase-7-like [Malaclemys terrapin pileata]
MSVQQRKNRAVIIVNYEFHGSSELLKHRKGAKREADKLFKALSKLNYAVKLHYDQEAQEIEEIYRQESREEHGDCFVSILSSHGEEGAIYDCRGELLKLTRIFQMLSPQRCPVLAGKPKIFFIQACRGNVTDPGVWVETDSGRPPADSFSHYLSIPDSTRPPADSFSHYLSIPDSTAVMFACSPGYSAFLSLGGSVFLQTLLEFLEGDERHLELARLMTRISWKVAFHWEAKGEYQGEKEMPCFVTNMVREVYPFSIQTTESSSL